MVEKAVKQVVDTYQPSGKSVRSGGDLDYQATDDIYTYIGLVAGGSSDRVSGSWSIDVDCFAKSYGAAMRAALDIEAILLEPGHRTEEMLLDNCYQDEGPAERPWDEEKVYRVGATYTFTARRSG